jgi:hypothetical protein
MPTPNLHEHALQLLQKTLANPVGAEAKLNESLRLLAKYRATLIQNTLVRESGTTVLGGPFKGMAFVERSAEGCHSPKLLGCYEQELHPFIAAIPGRNYRHIVNIGYAEGYYAVGLKRLCPRAAVHAFDTNTAAQDACRALAARNGVEIAVGGEFGPADFARFDGPTLVWCDIEGAEAGLLDPDAAPSLAGMDIVVELHAAGNGHTIDEIPPRFAPTHAVELHWLGDRIVELPDFFRRLGHLDRLLAVWEWRQTPTPWAIMVSRRRRV